MTRLELHNLSHYFQWVGSVVIAILCLYKYSQRPLYLKLLGFYAVLSILFSLAQEISELYFQWAHINTIGNGFIFCEAILLGLVFFYSTSIKSFRKVISLLLCLYIVFYIVVFLAFDQSSFSLIRFGRDILIIILSILYFQYLLNNLPEMTLLQMPMFWINSACIFFFSGTLILSLTVDYLVQVLKDDLVGYWAFRNFFRFFFCLVLAYAGWMNLQSIKQKAASKS